MLEQYETVLSDVFKLLERTQLCQDLKTGLNLLAPLCPDVIDRILGHYLTSVTDTESYLDVTWPYMQPLVWSSCIYRYIGYNSQMDHKHMF